MKTAQDTFGQAKLIWQRESGTIVSKFNEEESNSFTTIELKALMLYNTFRTWPLDRHEGTGELDDQNVVALLNVDYLKEQGYLTPQGYFDFQPSKDKFVHLGILYEAEGDTAVAQAKEDPLHIYLILRRQETKTGKKRFNT
jgi:hypothetical protein